MDSMSHMSFSLLLSFAVLSVLATAHNSEKTAMFIGVGKCTDCDPKDGINFKGVQLGVMCRSRNSTRLYWSRVHGNGEFDGNGKVVLQLPAALLKQNGGGLRRKCYAQLYSTSKKAPCPTQNHQELYRLVLTSKRQSLLLFGTPTGKFNFSRNACAQKNWNYPVFGTGNGVPIIVPNPTTPANKIYTTTPASPIYVPTPEVPVYVPTPVVPVYVPTPEAPGYFPTPKAPGYFPTPKAPGYVSTPETPVYVPTPVYIPTPAVPAYVPTPEVPVDVPMPEAPIHTYVPPVSPSYMPPATPVTNMPPENPLNNLPPGTRVIHMPPGTQVANMPPGTPLSDLPPGSRVLNMPPGSRMVNMPPGTSAYTTSRAKDGATIRH